MKNKIRSYVRRAYAKVADDMRVVPYDIVITPTEYRKILTLYRLLFNSVGYNSSASLRYRPEGVAVIPADLYVPKPSEITIVISQDPYDLEISFVAMRQVSVSVPYCALDNFFKNQTSRVRG